MMKRNQLLNLDVLSDLPMGILEIILMLLPIRDAIRTSILSTKWRYRWSRLPNLLFHQSDMISGDTKSAMRLKDFVTRTLYLHQGPIHTFDLHFGELMRSCPVTDQWLLFLSRRDIKELKLKLPWLEHEFFNLPSSLYSCPNLTSLQLFACQFGPPPPTFNGFLYLRTLILELCRVPSTTVESLVAASPLLEHLEYRSIEGSKLTIGAPNLKHLSVGGNFQEIHLCAPLLVEMEIMLYEDADFRAEQLKQKRVCNYTKFLGDFTNLESFTAERYFTKYLSIGIQYCQYPLAFHRLKFIALYEVNFQDRDQIMVAVRLITDAAANLRELEVSFASVGEDASKALHLYYWDLESPHNCTFKELKDIRIQRFSGALHELKFIKFLLESSPVLEKMIFEEKGYCPYEQPVQEPLDSRVELLGYRQASSNVNISFES